MCRRSRTEQKNLVRLKRGKKTEESPSAAKEREAKRSKQCDPKPASRQALHTKFALIHPKKSVEDVESKELLPESNKVRILPKSVQPIPAAEPSQGMQILANSGLRNREACKLQNSIFYFFQV